MTILHPYVEGGDYPAIVALARIGAAARPALVRVIEANEPATLEWQNAAHAIVLSFVHEPERDPGRGILYLRNLAPSTDPRARARLEQAASYILTTEACQRRSEECDKAFHQSHLK